MCLTACGCHTHHTVVDDFLGGFVFYLSLHTFHPHTHHHSNRMDADGGMVASLKDEQVVRHHSHHY